MFIETKLYTEDGYEVTTIQLPPFQSPPKAILWGERMFVLHNDHYREGFWWTDPTPEAGKRALQDAHILLLLPEVRSHLLAAMEKHAPMNSYHEAYAVIYEELCEFWDQVRAWPKSHDPAQMRTELLHMAAMCLRTIIDRKL